MLPETVPPLILFREDPHPHGTSKIQIEYISMRDISRESYLEYAAADVQTCRRMYERYFVTSVILDINRLIL